MKSIFRYVNLGFLAAALLLVGAIAASAQDPCVDADGQTKLDQQFRTQFADKTIAGRQAAIDTGKQFLEKYGSCDAQKDLVGYLKVQLPKMEAALKALRDAQAEAALTGKFDTALKANNWDDVYATGKDVLNQYPDKYRTVEIVLAGVGGEEAIKGNHKYDDDAMKYANLAIADLQSGKSFKLGDKTRYGLSLIDPTTKKAVYNFEFATSDDAIAWMNLYIGNIYATGKKDKVAALPYLFRATQATGSDASKNPIPYQWIGSYYFDALNKLVDEIKTAEAAQSDKDTPEVAQKKVDDIKALVAMANGTAERAMDAFARAANYGANADYKATMHKNVEDAYKLRFGKSDGVDTWIAANMSKPFPNPATPIQPVSDPEPAKTDVASPAKPATSTPAKPGLSKSLQ